MLYSSGTTGRPKGIKPALPDRQVGESGDPYVAVFGEIVAAMIQLQSGVVAHQDVADRIKAYLREHIAEYKVPRRIEFVDSLPRTPTGKLLKGALRKRLTRTG